MPKINKFSNNWPDLPVMEAANTNSVYTEIQTVSNNIGDGNVRTEGVHTRNLDPNVLVVFQGSQYNNYEAELGATPIPVDTNYENYADSGVRESPINHNVSGFSTTVPGYGTKLIVGDGTSGIAVKTNDIIRLSWQVTVWKVRSNTNTSGNLADLSMHSSDLITTAARSDGAGDGSGVGEWCYLIYPKINVSSNALNDSDFITISDANMYYATVLNPKTATVGIASPKSMAGALFDHCSVVNMCTLTQANNTTDFGAIMEATGDNAATSGWRRPYTISGGITLKSNTNTTIYGFQLFTSGVWRMDASTTQGQLFLENVECDPVNSRFGVSLSVTYEAASIDCTIMRGV